MRHALRERSPEDAGSRDVDPGAAGLGIDLARLEAQRVASPPGAQPPATAEIEVWPELWAPLALFRSCLGQLELSVGMGGAQWREARAVNVERHMQWLGIRGQRRQARVWTQYRLFEAQALKTLNDRLTKT